MHSKSDLRVTRFVNGALAVETVAVAASSTMLYFVTGLPPLWWVTWMAPLPILWISPRPGAWPAFRIATTSWPLGSMNMWPYLMQRALADFGVGNLRKGRRPAVGTAPSGQRRAQFTAMIAMAHDTIR